jgi:hypothetical protein
MNIVQNCPFTECTYTCIHFWSSVCLTRDIYPINLLFECVLSCTVTLQWLLVQLQWWTSACFEATVPRSLWQIPWNFHTWWNIEYVAHAFIPKSWFSKIPQTFVTLLRHNRFVYCHISATDFATVTVIAVQHYYNELWK